MRLYKVRYLFFGLSLGGLILLTFKVESMPPEYSTVAALLAIFASLQKPLP